MKMTSKMKTLGLFKPFLWGGGQSPDDIDDDDNDYD